MEYLKDMYWWIEKEMNNIFFQDEHQRYNVTLRHKCYKQMLYYSDKANPYETGGILIGNYSKDLTTANILQITPPPKNSNHKRNSFYRSSIKLKKILDIAWEQGYYYLGEWHYHPNSIPIPSNIDIKQMIDFSKAKSLKCPEPILVIIGGNRTDWKITLSVFPSGEYICLKCVSKLF